MKTHDQGLFQKSVHHVLNLPYGVSAGESIISLMGNREVSVQGCKGILEYQENVIRLHVGNKQIKITGDKLTICSLDQHAVVVSGLIMVIEFI